MNDDLYIASLIVVLALAAYPLFVCIWHVIGAYTRKFAPSEWEFDPEKPITLGRMKTPVLSALLIVGTFASAVVFGKVMLLLGVRPL